ncbi:hypothetical protein HPB50_016968 [Hyalomma asiaticum]|uniref:Uncharacterized protein n=1 Tax=Hyalomma asiaticum TaxID=266040 RepID=A0ACB7SNH8_HYAAI|nr:hypothetical protein HPB50_016968 [Hyalomma asiaticum]
MQCLPEYHFEPPRVRLMNTGGGCVRFSPNLHATGMVNLGKLATVQGEPLLHLENVLASIKSLLSRKPYFNQPGVYSETWAGELERYSRAVQHDTVRVAVRDAVEACLNESSQCPPYLREVMMKTLVAYYDKYVVVLPIKLVVTGTVTCDLYVEPTESTTTAHFSGNCEA